MPKVIITKCDTCDIDDGVPLCIPFCIPFCFGRITAPMGESENVTKQLSKSENTTKQIAKGENV